MNLWNYAEGSDSTLGNSLFRTVKLVKNANTDKYKYFGYGTELDLIWKKLFSVPTGGKNVISFGADMTLSVHFVFLYITRRNIFNSCWRI